MDLLRLFAARRRWRPTLASLALAAALVAPLDGAAGPASDVTPDLVKAALLYNFAQFTEWPALPSDAPIVACIVADKAIAAALGNMVRGKHVGDHAIAVQRPEDSSTWRACHLLFIADAEAKRSAGGLAALKSLPVLTVSDSRGFADAAGIIELYVDAGRMQFAINLDAVDQSSLHLSSRLLVLARIVRSGHVR